MRCPYLWLLRKKLPLQRTAVFCLIDSLAGYSVNRAGTYASSAVNTGVSVDFILSIARRDGVDRTVACASAAGYTLVADFMSHENTSIFCDCVLYFNILINKINRDFHIAYPTKN